MKSGIISKLIKCPTITAVLMQALSKLQILIVIRVRVNVMIAYYITLGRYS
jgi:hypothetical protein